MKEEKKIFGYGMESEEFYKKFFPNLTEEQKAEFEELASIENDGMQLEEMIARYRPELTAAEQAELLDEIDREVKPGVL